MKILITGNKNYGAVVVSRDTGVDLTSNEGQKKLVDIGGNFNKRGFQKQLIWIKHG